MKISSLSYILLLILALFGSCNNASNSSKDALLNSDDSTAFLEVNAPSVPIGKYDMVISDIPFPFEILDNLYSKKIPFDEKAMNEIRNISKYNQYSSKALNLGVYGADLAYAVTYEEFSKMGAYIKNTKRLAEELNIPYAFDQSMLDKYSKYKDNKDSLTKIVYESYNQVDKALKGDERVGMAALVVAGSWLEGLYISSKTFLKTPKSPENSSLFKVIRNQKQSLIIVIKLLEEYKEDPFISSVIADLNGVTSDYINITSDSMMNETKLLIIHSKIESLRKKIIEGQ
ncbi:MAG: hypothetical protein NTX97_10850 [Bacteroidetes bacterium]|nr:hypothetical protein [Bacteroidota bacterium]